MLPADHPLDDSHRTGPAGLRLLLSATALTALTGLLGPSAAQPPLPGGPTATPPYSLTLNPHPTLVTGLLLTAIGAGTAGLALAVRGLAAGWRPNLGRLRACSLAAVAAMVAVPPMGSADHLIYAAYGRLAARGADPYAATAADLAARGDPIGAAVEAPWEHVPSLYGPLATAEQWLASTLGGPSTHATVGWLQLFGAVAFLLTAVLLDRLAGPDQAARARIALLFSLNPLLLYLVVNAAHVDGFGLMFGVAGLLAVRRSAVAAGALAGLACAVKLSFGIYLLALAWALRPRRPGHRTPRGYQPMLTMAAAGGGVLIGSYTPIGLHGLDQLRAASTLVSFATPWRLVVAPVEAALGAGAARSFVSLGAWGLTAALVVLLGRAVAAGPAAGPVAGTAAGPAAGPAAGTGGDSDQAAVAEDQAGTAGRAAAVLTVSWLLAAPYSLPWYDVAAWAPVAATSQPSWFALLLTARTGMLASGYVPGRVMDLPGGLGVVTEGLRGVVCPLAGLALLVVGIQAARSRGRPPRPAPAPE